MPGASCTCATAWWWTAACPRNMHKLWRGIVRTFLWTYERGSWPYDVMVLIIVLFVLVTPRRWFHDGPLIANVRAQCVQPGAESTGSGVMTYRLDAACLPVSDRAANTSPKMEKDVHDLLSRSVPALGGRTFQIQSVNPLLNSSGGVQSYDVTVRPVNIP
jgi:hypothetical protein